MRRMTAIGGACGALCTIACASVWTVSVRAHLQEPLPAACVERTLKAQQVIDTTRIVADRMGSSAARELTRDSAGGSYAEIAFAAAGSHGRVVQTRDVQGEPIVTVSWTWSETLPADDSVSVVEDWLLTSLDTLYGACGGGSAGLEDVVVLRTWTLPDSVR